MLQNNDQESYVCENTQFSPLLIAVLVDYHPEYSAGGERRGRCRNFTFKNIHLYGSYAPRIGFCGYDENHKVENVVVDNVYWNGKLLLEFEEGSFDVVKFAENIYYQVSERTEL